MLSPENTIYTANYTDTLAFWGAVPLMTEALSAKRGYHLPRLPPAPTWATQISRTTDGGHRDHQPREADLPTKNPSRNVHYEWGTLVSPDLGRFALWLSPSLFFLGLGVVVG